MATSGTKEYSLLRGSEQVIRVNLLLYLWREALGYFLHPKIPQDVSKIADVATATGLWLCALNHERPGFEVLDGYDVSPQSFLSAADRPSIVKLEALDATKEVPEALRGKYDVVHVRLILPGILDGNPSGVINHCMQLLRPGGYLQWEEFDVTDLDFHIKDGVPRPSNLELATKTVLDGMLHSWIPELPEVLKAHGMLPIAVERLREPIWHRTTMTHLVSIILTEFSKARLDAKGPPGAGDEFRAKIKGALEENLAGSYVSNRLQVVVAQKPL